jgi:hypothetical protein
MPIAAAAGAADVKIRHRRILAAMRSKSKALMASLKLRRAGTSANAKQGTADECHSF